MPDEGRVERSSYRLPLQCFSNRRIVRCQLVASVDSARLDVVCEDGTWLPYRFSYVCSISLKLSISQYDVGLSSVSLHLVSPFIYDNNPSGVDEKQHHLFLNISTKNYNDI